MSAKKYLELAKVPTEYAKRMNHLSNKIFGDVSIHCDSKSMKVVQLFSTQPLQQKNFFVNWYPRHVETWRLMMRLREYGLYRDEHQDFKEEMRRLRALRGKVPPKRGEGKRATLAKSE